MNDANGRGSPRGDRLNFSQLMFLPRAIAFSVEVFLHTRIGERYADVQAAAALVIIPMSTLFWPGRDPRPTLCFLALYVLMCVRNRVEGLLARGRSPSTHSRYTGYPRLLRHFPKHDEAGFKLRVEPLLVFVFGSAVAALDEPLGVYLMVAAGCLLVSALASGAVERQMLLDLNDLVIEQRQRAERFRAMQEDQV